jgi:hypothetical protein
VKPLLAVRDLFAERATAEHWVASRTPHPHQLPGAPEVRLINPVSFEGWFNAHE